MPTERVYRFSLDNKQGNVYLHWHVAPLPPGVPYNRQQYYALMTKNGVVELDDSVTTRETRLTRLSRVISK